MRETVERYRAAQIARNHAITDWAETELKRVRAAGYSDRPFTVMRTWADPRMVDPTLEPTKRPPNMCYAGVPVKANRSAHGIAAASTLRNWIGMWSLRHAQTRAELDADEDPVKIADPNGLREWATSEPYHYAHEWRVGDTVMWDNSGTMHRARPYDPDCGRLVAGGHGDVADCRGAQARRLAVEAESGRHHAAGGSTGAAGGRVERGRCGAAGATAAQLAGFASGGVAHHRAQDEEQSRGQRTTRGDLHVHVPVCMSRKRPAWPVAAATRPRCDPHLDRHP